MNKKINNNEFLKYTNLLRIVKDFPIEGVSFIDITPYVYDIDAFSDTITTFAALIKELGANVIAGIESRGFLFAPAIAAAAKVKLIPIRKKGKLPLTSTSVTYDLEYGTASIEIPDGLLTANDKVIIIDDILATGGTLSASEKLILKSGATVIACCTLLDIEYLKKPLLPEAPIYSLFTQNAEGEIY